MNLDFQDKEKFILKVGSNMIIDEYGNFNTQFATHLAQEVRELHSLGKKVHIVTSGAIGLGKQKIEKYDSSILSQKQYASSLGMTLLFSRYLELFESYNILTGSILISNSDFTIPEKRKNLQKLISQADKRNTLLFINENDAVSTQEITFGDNDILAAHLTKELKYDSLVIYSQSGGVFENYGKKNKKKLDRVLVGEDNIHISQEKSTHGSGGMQSKFQAAQIVSEVGALLYVQGYQKNMYLESSFAKNLGTFFLNK